MKRTLILVAIGAMLLAPVASAKHSVSITNAEEAEEGSYTINVDVEGFTLRDFQGQSGKTKGSGHIHYLVNGEDACKAGKADCDAPTDYATPKTSFTFKNLEDGDKITVELVLDDHTASGTDENGNLDGSRVTDTVTVGASNGIPGFEAVAVIAGLGALAFVARRR